MSTHASSRLGVDDAPGGLGLVQDLLNTAAVRAFDVPDLLGAEGPAQVWLTEALDGWSRRTGQDAPTVAVRPGTLADLREGRTRVRGWLAGAEVALAGALVTIGSHGRRLTYGPAEDGAGAVLGLVAVELLLAQRDGTLGRLKCCANPACGAAFYDLSRNSSRVWHDVRTCGNVTNLRASRARRRAVPGEPEAGTASAR